MYKIQKEVEIDRENFFQQCKKNIFYFNFIIFLGDLCENLYLFYLFCFFSFFQEDKELRNMGEEAAKKINFLSSKKDKLTAVKSTISFKPSSSMAPTKLMSSASSSFQVWKNALGKKSHDDEATSSKINIVENPILDQAKKNTITISFANPDAVGVNLINTNQNRESRAGKSICLDRNLGKTEEDPKILKRYVYMDGVVCIYTKLYIFWLNFFCLNF